MECPAWNVCSFPSQSLFHGIFVPRAACTWLASLYALLWFWVSRDTPPGVCSQVLLGSAQKLGNMIYFPVSCELCVPGSAEPSLVVLSCSRSPGHGRCPDPGDADPQQPGFTFLAGSAVKLRNVISERFSNKKHGNETAR